jgi:hypothetical protein
MLWMFIQSCHVNDDPYPRCLYFQLGVYLGACMLMVIMEAAHVTYSACLSVYIVDRFYPWCLHVEDVYGGCLHYYQCLPWVLVLLKMHI